MSFWLVATIILYFAHLFLPSLFRIKQIGVGTYIGPRDNLPDLPTMGSRASRAADNLKETMPVFIGLAVLAIATQNEAPMALLGAQVFFFSRLLFVILYLVGIPLLRSFAWTGGLVGLAMMMMALL